MPMDKEIQKKGERGERGKNKLKTSIILQNRRVRLRKDVRLFLKDGHVLKKDFRLFGKDLHLFQKDAPSIS